MIFGRKGALVAAVLAAGMGAAPAAEAHHDRYYPRHRHHPYRGSGSEAWILGGLGILGLAWMWGELQRQQQAPPVIISPPPQPYGFVPNPGGYKPNAAQQQCWSPPGTKNYHWTWICP